jgi:hypothetical protein
MSDYSLKYVVVRGDTKNHRDELKKLGGMFNLGLKNPTGVGKLPGWIFSKKNIIAIEYYILGVNTEKACVGFQSIRSPIEDKISRSDKLQDFSTSGSDTEEMDIWVPELCEHELRILRLEKTYDRTKKVFFYISVITKNTLCYMSVGMLLGLSFRMICSILTLKY